MLINMCKEFVKISLIRTHLIANNYCMIKMCLGEFKTLYFT
jgi:hypothetical protein